jgi:hypothetical protein
VASRTARSPDGRTWEIRERWIPPVGGLPPNALADDFGDSLVFLPFAIVLALVGVLVSLLNWILLAFGSLASALFRAPLVEAERQGEPTVKLTWQTRSRHVGPRVIERIAAALERGETPLQVEDATFLGFDRP